MSSSSLWTDSDLPRDSHSISGCVEEHFEKSFLNDNRGSGGVIFGQPWLKPMANVNLKAFLQRVLNEVRFQTAEVFLAQPVRDPRRVGDAVFVAGAYRPAEFDRNKGDRNSEIFTGKKSNAPLYSIVDAPLKKLKWALRSGEPHAQVHDRLTRYSESHFGDADPISSYIDYTIGTILIADLVDGLYEKPRPTAGVLMAWIKEGLKDPKIFPRQMKRKVAGALRYLIEQNGQTMLEVDHTPPVFGDLCQDAEVSADAPEGMPEEELSAAILEEAYELWVKISENSERICDLVRKKAESLPHGLVRRLFAARLGTYPRWLSSATISGQKLKRQILYGSLRHLMGVTATKRNKVINSVSLDGYERATSERLISDPDNDFKPSLRSMLIVPFRDDLSGSVVSGLLRFMNRYEYDGAPPTLLGYDLNDETEPHSGYQQIWAIPPEEMAFTNALHETMKSGLSKIYSASPHVVPSPAKHLPKPGLSSTIAFAHESRGPHSPLPVPMIGSSRAIQGIREQIERVSRFDEDVLILGEAGTGKDLVAQNIHKCSRRSARDLIVVNCPSVSKTLAERELFGHLKGTFTEATADVPGKFDSAHHSTIFLDEIHHLSLETQAMLLRVLENRTIDPVGAPKAKHIDFRAIMATTKDLQIEVEEERFLGTLYSRLDGTTITVPPLRERLDDIPQLIEHFVSMFCKKYELSIPLIDDGVYTALREYRWPYNVRELKKVVTVVLQEPNNGRVTVALLPERFTKA